MLDNSVPDSVAGLRPGILFFRGTLALLFAAFCLAAPGVTLFALTFSVATYLAADGVASLSLQSPNGRRTRSWLWSMLSGVAGIVASAFVLFFPMATTLALGIFTGTWVLALGVLQLLGAIDADSAVLSQNTDNAPSRETGGKTSPARRSLAFSGAICLALGLVILAQPWIGVVALVTLLATSALTVGVASIALGLNLRRRGRSPSQRPAAPKEENRRRAA